MSRYENARRAFGEIRESMYSAVTAPEPDLSSETSWLSAFESHMDGHFPLRLYRYQPFDERNLWDMVLSRLHLSTLGKLNDVNEGMAICSYDKLLGHFEDVALGAIEANGYRAARLMDSSATSDQINDFLTSVAQRIANDPKCIGIARDAAQQLAKDVVGWFLDRSSVGSLCESPLSASMWDRYAKGHTGFVAAYDFQSASAPCACKRHNKCAHSTNALLVPVEYLGERPDITTMLPSIVGVNVLKNCPRSALYPEGRDIGPADRRTGVELAFAVHSFGHKAREWEHEREWRMLAWCERGAPKYVVARPSALYIGAKMEDANITRIVEVAENLGIEVHGVAPNFGSNDYALMDAGLIHTPSKPH